MIKYGFIESFHKPFSPPPSAHILVQLHWGIVCCWLPLVAQNFENSSSIPSLVHHSQLNKMADGGGRVYTWDISET